MKEISPIDSPEKESIEYTHFNENSDEKLKEKKIAERSSSISHIRSLKILKSILIGLKKNLPIRI